MTRRLRAFATPRVHPKNGAEVTTAEDLDPFSQEVLGPIGRFGFRRDSSVSSPCRSTRLPAQGLLSDKFRIIQPRRTGCAAAYCESAARPARDRTEHGRN